jgi:hypothetical protein
MTFRKIPHDVHEDARDATRALMGTPEFAKSRNVLQRGGRVKISEATFWRKHLSLLVCG